jgi:hypothetical protein
LFPAYLLQVEIPSMDDAVSKLDHMGRETVRKLADLGAAAAQAGLNLGLEPELLHIEKVGAAERYHQHMLFWSASACVVAAAAAAAATQSLCLVSSRRRRCTPTLTPTCVSSCRHCCCRSTANTPLLLLLLLLLLHRLVSSRH